ncbi:MAG TPA: maleylpyruvate isomerase N-terminal domain-containing protein [Dehalococcoidia bacterium]|jgi:uncharacterized damage-inducible protein DinB|nr:maleylpyruvate isomerase N-terminal domain-containing protein [Dehalococcoidia bacterium]
MPLAVAEAAVEDLTRAHRELLRLVDSLAEGDWERPVPYGEWTVKDLVSHVIGDMSPSGPGLILAGVLTPQFIADTSKGFDVRARNAEMIESRRHFTRDDLRQLLFEAHDAFIGAALRLDESHLHVLEYAVPMGPEYELRVEDWLWRGYHDRQHADDMRRALETEWTPEKLSFTPEIEGRVGRLLRSQEAFLRAAYQVANDAWDEESPLTPGWTYHDVLAHIASNERRLQTRFRSAKGEGSEEELAAVNDVEKWNAEEVKARRGRTMRELVDEWQAGKWETLRVLASLRPEHLRGQVTVGSGEKVPLMEFLQRVAAHTSRHAGQLVPGSRARRGSG